METMERWSGHGVLQVGVPELEAWIVERTRHYDPRLVSTDPNFRHSHITVLAPVLSWDAAAIAQVAASTPPFAFTLERIDVLLDGWINLRPDPDAHFRRLTRRIWDAHPAVVPFGGPEPTPHLTLDMIAADISVASTRALLGGLIPVTCRAEAIELVWYALDDCHLIQRWPLSGTT